MKDLDPLSNSVKRIEQQPSIPIPHSANSAQVQMIANETSRLPNRPNPHSLKSAPHQYQVVADHQVQWCRLLRPLSVKPDPHQSQVIDSYSFCGDSG